jgi:hypothetical protein
MRKQNISRPAQESSAAIEKMYIPCHPLIEDLCQEYQVIRYLLRCDQKFTGNIAEK